ncbi:phosphate ABC transporter substrate-binding protein [Terrilactibacillus laevilacticus]|uniref:Phosphate-binding protein n=1 Tax=Terrilactibacillus laevilacticus TaxID=1380157 RepID=A0ABW5PSZ8_9BACI|nr:phosphate ABC transporter substrate-binding protein [Terrilactibacillus laevilacticus]
MKQKKWIALTAILVLSLILSACGSKDTSSSGQSSNGNNKEELSGKIVIGGSTALQPLAAAAAAEFMKEHPKVQIEVQGGGSGAGLSEVSNGNFDIGMSDVFAESKSNIDASQLKDYKVAVVGMTAAVNKEAGIKKLSKEDLIKVFTGKVKNWSEVGGKNVKITLVNRPDGSGTRATFDEFALDKQTPAEGITQDSSNTVKKIVNETPGAIGYLALSYFNDDSIVKLAIDGTDATEDNVASGKFPVWAYEHMYTKGDPKPLVKAFIDYMMADPVQSNIVPAQGYLSVTKMQVERNAEGKLTNK